MRSRAFALIALVVTAACGGTQSPSTPTTPPSQPATQYALSVAPSPASGGTVTKSPDQAQYPSGTTVTLTATPATGYQFARWEGDVTGTTNPVTVTMNAAKGVTAVFTAAAATQYTLTVTVSPSAGGSIARSPNQTQYSSGTTVSLTATPAAGYQFSGWQGDVTGTTNPTTVVMNGNKSVTAVFTTNTPSQYTLTVAASPTSGGSVTKNPNQAQYNSGTTVTLSATPAAGYQFSGWQGDVTGAANPATLIMNGNKSVTAVFTGPTATQYTLTTTASPSSGGSITRSPNQTQYASGTTVTLTATPASGYQFTGWQGDLTGTTNPTTLVMNGNKSVTAVFSSAPVPSVSAPSSSTGAFTVSISYSWGPISSSQDWLELEESVNGAAFAKINQSTAGDHTNPWNVSLTRSSSGTYSYRARARVGSTSSYSNYSSTATVNVQAAPRSVTIVNNITTALSINQVVQVKVSTTSTGWKTPADRLTPDNQSQCLSLPGQSIAVGGRQTFTITEGSAYYVFIGIGKWDMDNFLCSMYSPFYKRRWSRDASPAPG